WQTTFDAILDGVALLDAGGAIHRCNAALAALLQLTPGHLSGRLLDALIPPRPGEPPLPEILQGPRRSSTERELGERTFQVNIDPVRDATGQVRGAVAIVTDITERKQLDQQLRHTQKLESIGLLAGGVAHDFNNLLMGILGNASLALDALKDTQRTRELLMDVIRASERAADLTRQLLAYAGKGRFVTGLVDLASVVHDLVPLIQTSI